MERNVFRERTAGLVLALSGAAAIILKGRFYHKDAIIIFVLIGLTMLIQPIRVFLRTAIASLLVIIGFAVSDALCGLGNAPMEIVKYLCLLMPLIIIGDSNKKCILKGCATAITAVSVIGI